MPTPTPPEKIIEEEAIRAVYVYPQPGDDAAKAVAEVLGPRRFRHLVDARRRIARRLKAEHGMKAGPIGHILRRDRSTVVDLLNGNPDAKGGRQ